MRTTLSTFSMQSLLNKLAALSVIGACASVIWAVGSVRLTKRVDAPQKAMAPASRGILGKSVSLADAAILGANARVGVVAYSDFQSPYCARFARETFPEVVKAYVNTGRAFIAFRHLPLETIHPHALGAAAMAECGRRQGKFWEFHDAIFLASPQDLQTLSSAKLAKSFAVDANKLENCVKGDGVTSVRRDAEFANALGVRGTPTFLFGVKENENEVRVLRREGGAIPFRAFAAILDETIQNSAEPQMLR